MNGISLVVQWLRICLAMQPWKRAWQPTPVSLPGEFPQTGEPGGLQTRGLKRVGCD